MIYLDNGATTRPFPNHYNFCYPADNLWLNSHSSYSDGDALLWKCRERIAKCINAKPNEIYFTSGGCEGNTWCINILRDMLERPVLVSKYEHKSIINNPRVITSNDIDNLDSCMLVNNETGVMFDVNSIHKDCVQGLGKVKIDVNELYSMYGTIMCTFSGHKIHGEKGVGFVWIKDNTPIIPLIYGGAQEFGVRGGTTLNLQNICKKTCKWIKSCIIYASNLSYEFSRHSIIHYIL